MFLLSVSLLLLITSPILVIPAALIWPRLRRPSPIAGGR